MSWQSHPFRVPYLAPIAFELVIPVLWEEKSNNPFQKKNGKILEDYVCLDTPLIMSALIPVFLSDVKIIINQL